MGKAHDYLVGKLIGLSRMMEEKEYRSEEAEALIWEGLFAIETMQDEAFVQDMMERVEKEMEKASPDCVNCKACWAGNYDYDMDFVREAEAPIREKKEALLKTIQEWAREKYPFIARGERETEAVQKAEKVLKAIGNNIITAEELAAVQKEILL
ncbi:MAG: hypothetical protein IKU83_04355 [Lachnospiraceae bacterium]|nr:hypothetical protein [Lachnospiraceae bacterium]